MISRTSSFASSMPATSENVTFFRSSVSMRARLLPNDRALFPPICIWRMKKNQRPRKSTNGPHVTRKVMYQGLSSGGFASICTSFSRSTFTKSGYSAVNVRMRVLSFRTALT